MLPPTVACAHRNDILPAEIKGSGHAAAGGAGRNWRQRDGRRDATRRRGWRRCRRSCAAHASFQGLPAGTRIMLDGSDDELLGRMAMEALRRELAYADKTGATELGPANYLAISGGGENGAYGAGLLTGWTALGTRPEFKARDRCQHRRADRALRLPRPCLRQGARALLHDDRQERRDDLARPGLGACWASRSTIRRRCCTSSAAC